MHVLTKPIEINFKELRSERQDTNNAKLYYSIKANDINMFKANVNDIKLQRILKSINLTKEECIKKCIEDDDYCRLFSCSVSKIATRQGSRDESEQLNVCNIISKQYGITITGLNATELRPTKDGHIITNHEMKTMCIPKDHCLKSFDGKITGELNGYIAAKVVYGSGGHQDNVFEEMDTIAEWWKTYKCGSNEVLIVLIETDLIKKFIRLQNKFGNVNNVMVFNHIQFQQYLIDNYSFS